MRKEQIKKLEKLGYDMSDEMIDMQDWDASCYKKLFKSVKNDCGIISAIDLIARIFLCSKGILNAPHTAEGDCSFDVRFNTKRHMRSYSE